jgi:hypothetical protein
VGLALLITLENEMTTNTTQEELLPFDKDMIVLARTMGLIAENGITKQEAVEFSRAVIRRYEESRTPPAEQPAAEHPCKHRCQYAHEVSMPEHHCAGQCQYENHPDFKPAAEGMTDAANHSEDKLDMVDADDLPELPKGWECAFRGKTEVLYSGQQMRAFALQAVAQKVAEIAALRRLVNSLRAGIADANQAEEEIRAQAERDRQASMKFLAAIEQCLQMLLTESDLHGALFKAEEILRNTKADAAIAKEEGTERGGR